MIISDEGRTWCGVPQEIILEPLLFPLLCLINNEDNIGKYKKILSSEWCEKNCLWLNPKRKHILCNLIRHVKVENLDMIFNNLLHFCKRVSRYYDYGSCIWCLSGTTSY